MGTQSVEALRRYLVTLPPGPVLVEDTVEAVQKLLATCWAELRVDGDSGGMEGYKLNDQDDRTEDLSWEPPVLSFTIVRHGAAAYGSKFGELQRWDVDVNQGAARFSAMGYRQLLPPESRLDVRPIANEIAKLILQGQKDPRLKWYDDGHVRVRIGSILPDAGKPKQTVGGRRRRFRQELEAILGAQGWETLRANCYGPRP